MLLALSAALAIAPPAVFAQGQGQGQGQSKAKAGKQHKGNAEKAVRAQGNQQKQKEHRGNAGKAKANDHDNRGSSAAVRSVSRANDDRSRSARGKAGRFKHVVEVSDLKPNLRRYAVSSRIPERIAAGVVSRGIARGLRDDDVVIRTNGDRVSLLNRSGVMLVDLDDERARNLGGWRVSPYDDDVKSGAPSFCRSGTGHPVFGRDWCLDKGFGLGDHDDLRWGRSTDVGDIIFRQDVDRGTLARSVLLGVLGDVVFNRLGLHALTLGYTDPLTGVWLGEPTGPRVLRVTSGNVPIAEIYDDNRDDRADALIVALRPW